MNMDECQVCGYELDDCYDDDPGWWLCRNCEWAGYDDALQRAKAVKVSPPRSTDTPETYARRLLHVIANDHQKWSWSDSAWDHMQPWTVPSDWRQVVDDVCRALREVRGATDEFMRDELDPTAR